MPEVPTKITFTIDKKYHEKKLEENGQPQSKYIRYRSKELPGYVFVHRPENNKWSVRKDMSANSTNSQRSSTPPSSLSRNSLSYTK